MSTTVVPAIPASVPAMPECSWIQEYKPTKRILRGQAYLQVKRVMDLILVTLALPLVIPVLLLCFILVKLEAPLAPAFFYQERTGKGGCRFRMLKFRTMVPNAEEMKWELMHLNELKWPDFKITNDPRVTRMGRLLRRTSLDELPQIWNVITGEMSLVGPRPTSFRAQTYTLWHTERLDVEPGITGLWQIAGRGITEFDTRLRMDIAYIERRCLALDIEILWRTVAAVFQQKGAH